MATKRKAAKRTAKQHAAKKRPAAKRAAPRRRPGGQTVAQFLGALDHPLKDEVEVVRQWILSVDPTIAEEVKWNAPSFRTKEFFVTFHLRAVDVVQLVFHVGSKPHQPPAARLAVDVPEGLPFRWLATDRGIVTLQRGAALRAQRRALESLVRQWIAAIGAP